MDDKKNIVIITDFVYPKWTAMGRIAMQTAGYIKDCCNVEVISFQSGSNCLRGDTYKGVKIYTLTDWRLYLDFITKKKANETEGIKKAMFYFCNCVLRGIGRFAAAFFFLDNRWWYQRKAYNLLEIINDKMKIDAIVSINAPIEAHIAAERFKHKHREAVWISYWVDLFACENYKQNIFISINKMKKIERNLLLESDRIMCTQEIYDVLQNRCGREDIIGIPYAINEEVLNYSSWKEIPLWKSEERITFLCMGAFYKKMRDPRLLLDIFSDANNFKFELHLYTNGDYIETIKKCAEKSNGKIIYHGIVAPDMLNKAIVNAHILVNVENDSDICYPSKVMEMISYRKPIINFYYKEHEGSPMNNYPLVRQIKMNSTVNEALDAINGFVKTLSLKRQPKASEIYSIYPDNIDSKIKKRVVGTIVGNNG